MKRQFSIFLILALCACTKYSTDMSSVSVLDEVSFQVAKALSPTKASFTGTVYNDDAFGAYAWKTGYPSSVYFMEAEKITKQDNAWKPTSKIYYWPKEGTVDFICFAPYNEGNCWFEISDENMGTANRLTANLSISPENPASDLLYSDKAINCGNSLINEVTDGVNYYTGVPVIFRHALSMIKLQITAQSLISEDKKSLAVISFKNASIQNVLSTGRLSLDLQESGQSESTLRWEGRWEIAKDSTTVNYEDIIDGEINIGLDTLSLTDNIIVLPQNLKNQAITLELDIALYDSEAFEKDSEGTPIIGEDGWPKLAKENTEFPAAYTKETIKKSISIAELNTKNSSWDISESSTYIITIAPFLNAISFDPCVAPWIESPSSDIIIKPKT